MAAQEIEAWLHSGEVATIAGLRLKPRPHPLTPLTPLLISRGQAAAFYTVADDGSQWIIKKFHPGRSPDAGYLQAIRSIIPGFDSFKAGKERKILSQADLSDGYQSRALGDWLAGTVLMPKISGIDWVAIADKTRSGELVLSREVRAHLCHKLAQAVSNLEKYRCAHRDLSCANLYIDETTWDVFLIDWDSVYHPNLIMPSNTTLGTSGYIAPFVWSANNINPTVTWAERADRFALAICCTEFLATSYGSAFAGDGGMFKQEDLRGRSGSTVEQALATLRREFPDAALLFEQTLMAQTYDECPSPEAWYRCTESILGVDVITPYLDEIPWSDNDFLTFLSRLSPPAPVWPAPPLPDAIDFTNILQQSALPQVPIPQAPSLPEDPWST